MLFRQFSLVVLVLVYLCYTEYIYVLNKSVVNMTPSFQVVMPTVEADVAFGLGKFNVTNDEIMSRVAKALDAVGMYEYMQVS